VGRSRISAAISESHVIMTRKWPTVGWIAARWKLEQYKAIKKPNAKVLYPSNQNLVYIEATLSADPRKILARGRAVAVLGLIVSLD
jgi:hypothetical protein